MTKPQVNLRKNNMKTVLVDGQKYKFPDDMPNSEIEAILRKEFGGNINPDEPEVTKVVNDAKRLPGAGLREFLFEENPDLTGGVIGSVALGAKLGAPFGPAGITAGGIIGGTAGVFSGLLLSDLFKGKELDFANAVNESAKSFATDIATLGIGKFLKPGFFAIREALGYTPEEVARQLIRGEEIFKAGGRDSLRVTQAILQEGITEGGEKTTSTLTRLNAGSLSPVDMFAENVAKVGILSQGAFANRIDDVSRIVQVSLNDVVNKVDYGIGNAPSDVGKAVYDIIAAGKDATIRQYGEGLNKIKDTASKSLIDTAPVRNQIDAYLKQNQIETVVKRTIDKGSRGLEEVATTNVQSTLDKKTLKFINESIQPLFQSGSQINITNLLEIDKLISGKIREFGAVGPAGVKVAPVAERELQRLHGRVQVAIEEMMQKADPKNLAEYKKLKRSYAKSMQGLLPNITSSFIAKADEGSFFRLGKALTTSTDTDRINAFLKSIDTAYANIKNPSQLAIKNAEAAKKKIRQGFLANEIPELVDNDAFDINKYSLLAQKFSRPEKQKQLQTIMGKDYSQVQRLFNVMADASDKDTGNIGSILIRSRELSGATGGVDFVLGLGATALTGGLATAATGSTVAGGATGAIAGAATIFAPVVLARLATNPKAVARILAFEQKSFKTPDALYAAGLQLTSEVINMLDKEEQFFIRSYFDGESK